MQQVIFPKDVEVGNFYRVPCVKVQSEDWMGDEYCPISTHRHEDKKVIKFDSQHWHIDWRFVSGRMWRNEVEGIEMESKRTSGLVICFHEKSSKGYQPSNSTSDSTIYYRRLKAKRHYLQGEAFSEHWLKSQFVHDKWPAQLQRKFCQSKLKEIDGQLVCPHKGAVIDKNCKDHDGNYVCPAHLLRFNPETLEAIKL